MADLEPDAQIHYAEMMQMSKQSRISNQRNFGWPAHLLVLKISNMLNADSEDAKDIHKAVAKVTPFFHRDFFKSKTGKPFKESMMFRQLERSKILPTCRKHHSNKTRPDEFFKEFDDAQETMESSDDLNALPEEWDIVMKPKLAQRKSYTFPS